MPQTIMIMVRTVNTETYELEIRPDETLEDAAKRAWGTAEKVGWSYAGFRQIENAVDSEKIYVSDNDGANWDRVTDLA